MFARTHGFESHSPRHSYLYKSVYKHKTDRGLRRNKELSHNHVSSSNQTQVKREQEEGQQEIISRKINSITKSCSKPYFNTILKKLAVANYENADTICEYIIAEETELNIKNSTKEAKIKVITWLSNFYDNTIDLKQMTKQDILEYLRSLKKTFDEDPSQRWIGSYNGRQIILNKFFRWLYNPNEPDHKKRATPLCMKGIKQLPRKEINPYSPSDLWEPREHRIFLNYCPSIRDRCYHALANEMSARPHDILNLKIKDILFKKTEDGNRQYAEVVIKGGKTRPRTIPLIDSIPYVKELISTHPNGSNANSWLFVSNSNSTFGSKLTYDGISYQYKSFYKKRYFPKLLEMETSPKIDKDLIQHMLTKPWNLYIFRHSALTEKARY